MLTRDLHDPFIAILRAGTIALIGFGVGAISRVVHRLIARTVREERARAEVAALFGQYVSHPVVERLLRDKGRLAGERATAAILFSDLRGFTSFSEGRSPEEIVASLNAYFEHMVPAIEREGGIVDKFIGDAIMVVFGGVFTHPDPAGAAVRAARGMRNALAELNREREASGAQRLENGIGIHLGPVVQGPLGGVGRKEFTVIGDAVNTAARLESITKDMGATVIVSRAVLDALTDDERATFAPLGDVQVKGKAHAIEIYGWRRTDA
jgi:class 3 adenylate cyclase